MRPTTRSRPARAAARRRVARRPRGPTAGRPRESPRRNARRRTRRRLRPEGSTAPFAPGSRPRRRSDGRRISTRSDGARRPRRVEGDEHVPAGRKPLQGVHPVGDARAVRRPASRHVVPARPGRAPARHERLVEVEVGLVAAVAEGAEQRPLPRVGRRPAAPAPRRRGSRSPRGRTRPARPRASMTTTRPPIRSMRAAPAADPDAPGERLGEPRRHRRGFRRRRCARSAGRSAAGARDCRGSAGRRPPDSPRISAGAADQIALAIGTM